LSKIGILRHSFFSRYATKPIQGYKDVDFSQVSKEILRQKMSR